jgi:hypothetical protein
MPRNRNLDDNDSNKMDLLEEDYLDVDKPLPGQNFYCISFVSPDKVLSQKEMYFFHHYEKTVINKLKGVLMNPIEEIISNCEDGTVDISEIIKLKKGLDESCTTELCTFDQFKSKFEDFKFADEEKLCETFDKANNFQTSVRGVKVRGVFDSKRDADVRASVLQRSDPSFDVFIGQVGYWCPWDPNAQKIDDIEYLNNDLNKLVKEYKSNEAKKDMFYNEQKAQRQKDSISTEERLRHKEELAKTISQKEQMQNDAALVQNKQATTTSIGTSRLIDKNPVSNLDDVLVIENTANQSSITSLDLGGENSKEISVNDQEAILSSVDPWMQRKTENTA